MKRHLIFPIIILFTFSLSAQKDSTDIKQFVNKIDERIPQLLEDFLVPGAAIAIIENGEIIIKKG